MRASSPLATATKQFGFTRPLSKLGPNEAHIQRSMELEKDRSLFDGIFFLDLLSAVHPRAVNWSLVTRGVTDEEKRMNATYVISIARKLGCLIFLLPEHITEVKKLEFQLLVERKLARRHVDANIVE